MASINLHVVGEVCRRFSAFAAAHFILTMRKFRRQTVYAVLLVVTLVLIPSHYKKCCHRLQYRISEENQQRI